MAAKKPYTDKIFKYITEDKYNEICTLNKENYSEFLKNLKEEIKSKYNLCDNELDKYKYDIVEFFKAVIVKHYLDVNYPDKLQDLCKCSIELQPQSKISDIDGLPFDSSRGIANGIRKMIKNTVAQGSNNLDNQNDLSKPNTPSTETDVIPPTVEGTQDNNDDLSEESEFPIDFSKECRPEDSSAISDEFLDTPETPDTETNTNTILLPKDEKSEDDNSHTETKPDLTLDELKSLIQPDSPKFHELLNLPHARIHELLTFQFQSKYNITPSLIDEYITTVIETYKPPNIKAKKTIDRIVLIKKESAEEIASLNEKLKIANDENFSLQQELEKVKNECNRVLRLLKRYKPTEEKNKDIEMLHFTTSDFSNVLNTSTTSYTVDVKASLMHKACEYVDALNLIKTKNVITTTQDLYSEIIQVILIDLFKENELF